MLMQRISLRREDETNIQRLGGTSWSGVLVILLAVPKVCGEWQKNFFTLLAATFSITATVRECLECDTNYSDFYIFNK
jgi:hypothetical protein